MDFAADRFAAGDQRDRVAHRLRHTGRAGEPRRLPERLAEHRAGRNADRLERRRIRVQQGSVNRHQPLEGVAGFENGAQPGFFGAQLRGPLGDLRLQRFVEATQRFLGGLAVRDVAEIDRQAAIARRERLDLEPAPLAFVMILERGRDPFRHGAMEMRIDRGAQDGRIGFPQRAADQLAPGTAQHPFGRGIDVGEAPGAIQRQEAVVDAGQDPLGPLPRQLRCLAQFVLDAHRFAPQFGHVEIGADTGEQLAGAEWLGQVVVGARGQAFDPGFLSGARRQQQDRRIAQLRVFPQLRQQTKSIEIRHHDIGQHQMRPRPSRRRQRQRAIRDGFDPIARGQQQPAQIIPHVGVIVREQDQAIERAFRQRDIAEIVHRRDGRAVIGVRRLIRQPAQCFVDIRIRPDIRGDQRR